MYIDLTLSLLIIGLVFYYGLEIRRKYSGGEGNAKKFSSAKK